MADMIEMKTLTIDDKTYEIVDAVARSNANTFVAEYGVTTSAELEAAYNAGKLVILVNDEKFYTLTSRWGASNHSFSCPCYDYTLVIDVDENAWGEPYSVNFASNNHDHKFDDNVTGGSTNDTVAFWIEKGPGYCWISETGMIVNQPNQYGFLINYVNEGDVFQIFRDQTNARTYHRSGDNINGWFDSWAKVVTTNGDDVATTTTPGLVMVDGTAGIGVNTENGNLYIKEAETNEIDGKEHSYKPITPNNLDYAVKAGVTNNANTLSDTEKTAARQWIGAASTANAETWVFTLADGSTVSKEVILK